MTINPDYTWLSLFVLQLVLDIGLDGTLTSLYCIASSVCTFTTQV